MKKKLTVALLVAIIFLIQGFSYAAEANIVNERLLPRLVDDANLLIETEFNGLLNKLDTISESQGIDIIVVTVNSLEGNSPTEFADDVYDYNGFGFGPNADGILLLLSMEERDWAISTTGYGITVFTDAGQGYIIDEMLPYLGDGEYYEAFNRFADLCEEFVLKAKTGDPYDVKNLPKKPLGAKWVFISLAIGLILAFIITGAMKNKLKSVRTQSAAANYIVSSNLDLGGSRDIFLYNMVNKRPRPKASSSSSRSGSTTHTSSSGRTHGGSSGKF